MNDQLRNDYSGNKFIRDYQLIRALLKKKGCSLKREGRVVEVEYRGKICHISYTETTYTSAVAFRILKDKCVARSLFERIGVNTAVGAAFDVIDRSAALEMVKDLGLAVIKPADGNKGKGVSVGVSPANFDDAWESAVESTSSKVLVERCFDDGIEARYLVIDGKCVAVCSRIPPFVIGDGVSSIAELNERRDNLRVKFNPSRKKKKTVIDEHRKNLLAENGFTIDSVPGCGERILLDWKAGLSTGGDSRNITSQVHPEMMQVAESIAWAIPGLDVYGVDILARDHASKPTKENYIVIEANTRPGLSGHQYPDFGEAIDVCSLFVESLMRRMRIR